jgi:hypothetical protein
MSTHTVILLIDCPDRKGLFVAIVSTLGPNWRDIK